MNNEKKDLRDLNRMDFSQGLVLDLKRGGKEAASFMITVVKHGLLLGAGSSAPCMAEVGTAMLQIVSPVEFEAVIALNAEEYDERNPKQIISDLMAWIGPDTPYYDVRVFRCTALKVMVGRARPGMIID